MIFIPTSFPSLKIEKHDKFENLSHLPFISSYDTMLVVSYQRLARVLSSITYELLVSKLQLPTCLGFRCDVLSWKAYTTRETRIIL